jgi:GT2 family glycosyltransferase
MAVRQGDMSRRLDLGIASYRAPEKLARTISSIQQKSVCDLRIHVFHNPSDGDDATREVISRAVDHDRRVVAHWIPENVGYAGAVNALFEVAETEYWAYADNDIEIHTKGWDEALCQKLDAFHEVGMIFPNGGPYPINRGAYVEVLWGVGYCWIMTRLCASDLKADGKTAKGEVFDTAIGHQNEADACQRVRMAGYKCAAIPQVQVHHDATATNNPASLERINRGVVEWVTKWNHYFNGKNFNYHSPNVTRFEDWPCNALYLEEYFRPKLPGLNDNPEVVTIDGRQMDLIKVPRYKDFYRQRII